jgi:hypothetical protein
MIISVGGGAYANLHMQFLISPCMSQQLLAIVRQTHLFIHSTVIDISVAGEIISVYTYTVNTEYTHVEAELKWEVAIEIFDPRKRFLNVFFHDLQLHPSFTSILFKTLLLAVPRHHSRPLVKFTVFNFKTAAVFI